MPRLGVRAPLSPPPLPPNDPLQVPQRPRSRTAPIRIWVVNPRCVPQIPCITWAYSQEIRGTGNASSDRTKQLSQDLELPSTAVPEQGAGQLDQPDVVGRLLVVAHQDGTGLGKPGHGVLHHPFFPYPSRREFASAPSPPYRFEIAAYRFRRR